LKKMPRLAMSKKIVQKFLDPNPDVDIGATTVGIGGDWSPNF